MLLLQILALIFLAAPALAQDAPPVFDLPLSCTIGKDCWVLNYPDIGPDKDGAATDAACLSRTYEEHKGTDFAIADEAAMNKGVDVLAAAGGTVLRARDGEADRWPTEEDLDKTRKAKRECGNAVLIDHGASWQTMYCHLKKGSVTVKPGQTIKAGEKIGQVGLSGLTEFPHLHFGILHKEAVVDPFTGRDIKQPCGKKGGPLWKPSLNLAYEPLAFFDLGFDLKAASLKEMDKKKTQRSALRRDTPALVFHAVLLGVREGDVVDLSILSPDGKTFAQKTIRQEKNRARQMYYIGRKARESGPLSVGLYTGKVTVKRKDKRQKQKFQSEKTIAVQ